MRNSVSTFDIVIARWVGHIPKPWYRFFVLLGAVVRPLFWIVIGIAAAVYFFAVNLQVAAITILITTLLIPLSTGLKLIFRRSRPVTIYTENMRIKSYSFPSSHSYAAAVGSAIVSYSCALLIPLALPYVIPFLLLLAMVVGISRIYVGAHYPSDVLGGLLLGWAVAGIIIGAVLL